jgi:hypothetical protein
MNEQPGGEIILYQRGDAPAIDVRLDGDTVWLSQQQLADLFQTSRTNVVEHIANIYAEGELRQEATCREFRQVRTEGNRQITRRLPYYNLDLIISLGYRVRSHIATAFRIWATERLREYLVKGFTMDDARLKNLGGGGYWKELLERIRDIRSSEKVLYRQVLAHAEAEYAKFRSQLAEQPSEVEAAYLETVKAVQKKISGKKKP